MKHKIAIIDTGVDLNNDYLKKIGRGFNGIQCYRTVSGEIECVSTTQNPECIQDYLGHGTAVLSIILSHNVDVDLFVVKLFNNEYDQIDEGILVYALKYLYNNTECDIINLSMSISFIKDCSVLYDVCDDLVKQGRIIIASFENAGALSFPAEYDNVVGVTSGNNCYKNEEFVWVENSPINVFAKGRKQKVRWLDNKYIFEAGNSLACAHFSGIVSTYEGDYMDSKWKVWAKNKSKMIIGDSMQSRGLINPVEKYKKAVIFPFNKEMHSIVRFSDLLPFELVQVYDLKYSALVSAFTDDLLKEKCYRNYQIQNIENIEWDKFDTFILGHTNEYFSVLNDKNFKRDLINNILEHGKNIYSLDNVANIVDNPSGASDKIFYPYVDKTNVPNNTFDKLYRIDLPVLGIFGTSSQQGKFSLQLYLRRIFLEKGYKVTQIGTEPTALLYGMDIVFPMGYSSSVKIQKYDSIKYLNHLMWESSRQSDLIIIGGQSGCIPHDTGSTINYNFENLELLYATMPDAILLLINPSDDIEIITRTIRYVESVSGGKVLALIMSPIHNNENYNVNFIINEIESNEHIRVYSLNDMSDLYKLFNDIIDYFN